MENYNKFAAVYDNLIGAPYDEWVEYLIKIWRRFGYVPKLVCDLGCGTGNITRRLANRDYETIGVDISAEMLAVARQKDSKTLFLNQDMREFELFGTVDSVISLCDSLNYILDDEELVKIFSLVENYLNPGGLFIFDINSEYKFTNVLAKNTFSHADENTAYIWDNYYDRQNRQNEYSLTVFTEIEDNKYERFDEIHIQRAYSIKEISSALNEANLDFLAVYHELSFSPPHPRSHRIFFVAQKRPLVIL
ncbi:MAG: class I SAM-dependent methyltransferase [Defluviitaleaceae bacterium]|nr:class I SAM-dependent methyltransferase [Defluviitaleaceae bacterium]